MAGVPVEIRNRHLSIAGTERYPLDIVEERAASVCLLTIYRHRIHNYGNLG
jgi:hypothetical protein